LCTSPYRDKESCPCLCAFFVHRFSRKDVMAGFLTFGFEPLVKFKSSTIHQRFKICWVAFCYRSTSSWFRRPVLQLNYPQCRSHYKVGNRFRTGVSGGNNGKTWFPFWSTSQTPTDISHLRADFRLVKSGLRLQRFFEHPDCSTFVVCIDGNKIYDGMITTDS
jgi:hypothetical protein